ncbi:hypothetical protein M407DRAFT_158395 [Tulasnella calospora MUT 4182]|uniref:Uncharacterized protein n=1 Tax=Tulasnella calospora MUT 4182 TaxID=1051891 RepID=A0A0C3M8S4_9AGAM|nr:hypothetical protein M407DRAFT_158395 [Tulasnella calospora MUT 4182]
MWTLRPAQLPRCAPTLANPVKRSILRVQHHQVRNAQAAAACLLGAADSNTLTSPQFPAQQEPKRIPFPIIALPHQQTQNAASARTIASEVRLAIQRRDFARGFQLHRNFQASPAPVRQSRLVTTSLVHALLRAGRRFKAAQVAEIALLGSPSSGPSIFGRHRTQDSNTPLKLSATTSEAIILALCPLASSTTPAPPPWRIFLTRDQIGQNAARELEWRRKLANEELDMELKIAAEGEKAFLPDLTSHGYFVRHMVDKSDGIGCRQERALDKSTRRALTFLRVARKAKQRRTSMMFQALVDACLLQGEIIIGTLLFVLLVKEFHASQTIGSGERLLTESDGILRVPSLPSGFEAAADTDPAMLRAVPTGRGWIAPVTMKLSSVAENAEGPGYHPELSPPSTKPKHRPRTPSGIERTLQNLLGIIRFPIAPALIDTGSRSLISHLPAIERYPQASQAKCDIAMSCLVKLVSDGLLHPVSPQLLDVITDYPETNTHSMVGQGAPANQMTYIKPTPVEERTGAIEAVIARSKTTPSQLTKIQFHALLKSAAFGLKSTVKMVEVLDMMEQAGVPTNDDETLALLLRGCIRASDWDAADTVVQRIRVIYEQRETTEKPFREPGQETVITPTFDLRIPLLIYGHKSFDSNGFSPETGKYQFVRSWLSQKQHVAEILPPGPPILLNALLEWMTITGRAHFIAENIDYLLAVAYVDSKSGFKDSLDLAASFGPEFYQRIIKALQVDGGFINLGFAERIWSVAKRAEAHSWAIALQTRSDGRWAETPVGQPWSLGSAHVPLMEFYALGHKMRAVQRPVTWPATRPLNPAKHTKSVWWQEASMLLFGRHEKPKTTQHTAALRAMELHKSIMTSTDDTSKKLYRSWQDANRSRGKRSGDKEATSSDGLNGGCIASLSQPEPVAYQSDIQGILAEPGYSYWTALLSVVSGLKTLVPVFDHPKVPANWPIVKQEGAYLVEIQPFEASNTMSRALLEVITDMKGFGWAVGEVVPMSREEELKRRAKTKEA